MRDALILLDRAIELGRRELAHLEAGDLDQAEALAFGREGAVGEALSSESLAGPAAESLDTLLAKLTELKDLQARIIDEATRLRDAAGAELKRTGQEQRRHAGYGRSTRPARMVQSSFISCDS